MSLAVNSTHKEAKEHYATNNLLSDTLRYLNNELALLNSVSESYAAASGSAQGRTDFLQQLDGIVLNVKTNQNKVGRTGWDYGTGWSNAWSEAET